MLTFKVCAARPYGQGYDYCIVESYGILDQVDCKKLSPQEVAQQRARTDTLDADYERRYEAQEALPIPTSKADVTLICNGLTVQVWFGAGVLAWGTGEAGRYSVVWTLDKVTPAEINFERVRMDYLSSKGEVPRSFSQAEGHIDRVTGRYSLFGAGSSSNYYGGPNEVGRCEAAAPKF
jgi:hypothetical protein